MSLKPSQTPVYLLPSTWPGYKKTDKKKPFWLYYLILFVLIWIIAAS